MRILLDTHALVWWFDDSVRLGPEARALVANHGNQVCVSIVSLWEIAIKLRVGKITSDIGEIADAIDRAGFMLLNVVPADLVTLVSFPTFHRDPFDHLLISQAITALATLMSEDRRMPEYPIQVVACSN